ncbi:MAG: GIY-YIG nuclease family protein [Geobacteraceae bacterium]|nr:GIY-YIG nuclease family protein [Geobacteraceae bacterium]
MNWQVYMILCSDDSLYTGITTDIQRRFLQHASGRGAKYFRGHRPLEVVYREEGHTRSSASKREREIKSLERPDKLALISSERNDLNRKERPSDTIKYVSQAALAGLKSAPAN